MVGAAASEEEENGGGGGLAADANVGTIVWVRRRNGSWWPGRILGPQELPESTVMSPRTGTPVKLLGREDASVDWYNLEKSKRVKAFRCGEFDACIEKAEALQGNPTRKREKYARREDAILHALELERKQLMERQPHASLTLSKNVGSKTSDSSRRGSNKYSLKGESELFEGSKIVSSKEDASEVSTRTRGLQDFGLPIASSKSKLSQHLMWESLQKSYDNDTDIFPSSRELIGGAGHSGSGKISSESRKKKAQGGLSEGSLKKRDRRRPLVQVLQNSAKLPVSYHQPDNDGEMISEEGSDKLGAKCKGKRSRCIYLPTDSNSGEDNFGYPCEEMPTKGTHVGVVENLQDSGSSSEETETTSSAFLEMNDSGSSEREFSGPEIPELDNISSGSGRHVASGSSSFHVRDKFDTVTNGDMQLPSFEPIYTSVDTEVSKWHMKGKRNVRNLAKRSEDVGDDKILFATDKRNGALENSLSESNNISMSKKARTGFSNHRTAGTSFYNQNKDFDNDFCVNESFRSHRNKYPLSLKGSRDHGRGHSNFNDSEDDSYGKCSSGWELVGSSRAARMAYCQYSGRRDDGVVDVVLKVQASNTGSHGEREHVPLVSLMSRLNGKAIVGHPIQIEKLEDGSTFMPASRISAITKESPPTPPAWRTARRTVMQRVPRANPSQSELEGGDADFLEARPFKKSSSHKKSGKKVSLSNQKTRKLSALSSEHRRRQNSHALRELIKGGGPVPLVTCVPLKVVFSRLLESIGRPSSTRVIPRDPS